MFLRLMKFIEIIDDTFDQIQKQTYLTKLMRSSSSSIVVEPL
jgi:hypothetical protein